MSYIHGLSFCTNMGSIFRHFLDLEISKCKRGKVFSQHTGMSYIHRLLGFILNGHYFMHFSMGEIDKCKRGISRAHRFVLHARMAWLYML
jgi:hypothetical protein